MRRHSFLAAAVLVGVAAFSWQARAALPAVKIEEVKRGTLLFADPDRPGQYLEASILSTEIDLDVAGVLLRGEVRQRYTNDTGKFLEGVYVFPLSEGAAVDDLTMIVGDRVIEGQIHERGEALRIYETAKVEGKKASLVVEQRPNVFTTSVANIAPGETIEIDIGWQEVLRYDAGKVSLRVPLVVAPRYAPQGEPDAQCFTGPTATHGLEPRVKITAHIEPGFPVAALTSLHHEVATNAMKGGGEYVVMLDRSVPADRDFVLEWTAKPLTAPTAALFTQHVNGEGYALLLLVPPTAVQEDVVRLPRETIFVVDTSGSMGGQSMEQAKQALVQGLTTLSDEDTFNIVQFNSYASTLFDAAVPATRGNLTKASDWVLRLNAEGGTEMLMALRQAMNGVEKEERRIRQIVFITDGAVTNEAALFEFIQHNLGSSRLFTVGIGSAPNSFFMKRAAEFGRGTYTYIGATHEVQSKMTELFGKIESPVLGGVDVEWGDPTVEAWPQRIPDLYAGEPLVVAAKLMRTPSSILVRGRLQGRPWTAQIELPAAVEDSGVAKLWAKRKIEALVDAQGTGEDNRAQIVSVALTHHLVSKYTSLVAVDVTPARAQSEELSTTNVPTALPAGSLPKGGTASTLLALLAMLLLVGSAATFMSTNARRPA